MILRLRLEKEERRRDIFWIDEKEEEGEEADAAGSKKDEEFKTGDGGENTTTMAVGASGRRKTWLEKKSRLHCRGFTDCTVRSVKKS